MGELARMDVHGTEFGTSIQRWDILSGVQQCVWVPCCLDTVEQQQFVAVKLRAHLVNFFSTNTVLASNGAADLYAQLEYSSSDGLGFIQLTRYIGVKQNEWV